MSAKKKKKAKSKFLRNTLFLTVMAISFLIWKGIKSAKQSGVAAMGFEVKGVDVSHHNGKIDWPKLANQNVHFAYIKLSEGESHLDKHASRNYEGARSCSIKTGMYHFFRFKRDGVRQAQFFLKNLKYDKTDLPPVVDVEYSPYNKKSYNKERVSKIVAELAKFDSVVYSQLKIHPVIYTNKECYEDLIRDRFEANDLWMCNLSEEPDDELYPNWIFWQHSHTGRLEGLRTDIDMNVFYSDRQTFHEWLKRY